MFDELTKEEIVLLVERYPFLLPYSRSGTLPENYDYTYIFPLETPIGWDRLVLQMCEDIRLVLIELDMLNGFRFTQIKEKYGQLKCYADVYIKEIEDIFVKYEFISQFVCSQCGQPAVYKTTGWIIPLCSACYHDGKRQLRDKKIKFQDYYYVHSLKDNEDVLEEVSIKEEWDRYVNSI